jgi:hypothetical protein
LGGIADGVCIQLWEIEKCADEGIGYGFGARLVLGMETENSLPTHRQYLELTISRMARA